METRKKWKNVRVASLAAIAVFAVLFLFVSPLVNSSGGGSKGVLGAIPKASVKIGGCITCTDLRENPHGDQIAGFQFEVIAPFSST